MVMVPQQYQACQPFLGAQCLCFPRATDVTRPKYIGSTKVEDHLKPLPFISRWDGRSLLEGYEYSSSITGDYSKQDQILAVKIGLYKGFCVCRGFYILRMVPRNCSAPLMEPECRHDNSGNPNFSANCHAHHLSVPSDATSTTSIP